MPETLLSFSEVLLFGRKVTDLEVRSPGEDPANTKALVVATRRLGNATGAIKGHPTIDGVKVAAGNLVLATREADANNNGIYKVANTVGATWAKNPPKVPEGDTVYIEKGRRYNRSIWLQEADPPNQVFSRGGGGLGRNRFLDNELEHDACFARIYGFAYEGTYYELPHPTLFLVHGDGESATAGNQPPSHASRAPTNPSVSGMAAADFQFANDIRMWPYDKADYTIRMDVETGMFEQVLLDMFFGNDFAVAGAKVSGAKVSGAKVSGAKVSGAKVSGAKARGPGD